MSHNRHIPMRRQRRLRGIAVGLGSTAGALLASAMSQLATAPTARADDFTDILNLVESTIGAGQLDFTSAQADFALGTPAGFAEGVALDNAGTNDFLIGSTDDILAGSLAAAVGETPGLDELFLFPTAADPATLADLETAVTGVFTLGTDAFSDAEAGFALGTPDGFAFGVSQSLVGLDFYTVLAPEQALLGLADLAGL